MTGNKIAWRAPLAGLASLAMVATMGVTALSANAADAEDWTNSSYAGASYSSTYTVTFKSGDVTVATVTIAKGDSLADALGGVDNVNLSLEDKGGKAFLQWNDGASAVDFNAPVNGDKTLTASYVAKDIKVTFEGTGYKMVGGKNEVYVAKNTGLKESQLPVDVAGDAKVIKDWIVKVNGQKLPEPVATADLVKEISFNRPENTNVTVTPNKFDNATTLTFDNKLNGISENDAFALGAYADGSADRKYTVDVVDSVKAPAIVVDDNAASAPSAWTNGSVSVTPSEDVKPGDEDVENVYVFDPEAVATYHKVTFDAGEGAFKDGSSTKSEKVVDGTAVKAPEETPTRDGYTFKGWLKNGKTYDFTTNVRGDFTLTADWYLGADVQVTFKAGDYQDAPKDVKVKAAANGYLTADQVPSWTRAGYHFAGWNVAAPYATNPDTAEYNAKGKLDVTDVLVDKLVEQWGYTGVDVTLTAVWTPVDDDTVKEALTYVTDKDGTYFTADSFAEFEKVWKSVSKAYTQAVNEALEGKISAETATKLYDQLDAAWQGLVFAHEGGADVNLSGYAVHRLYNAASDEHFYTQDAQEIRTLTDKYSTRGGWSDEGVLFWTFNKNEHTGDKNNDGIVDEGESWDYPASRFVKAGVLTEYVRFYQPSTGDHVWTVKGGEEYAKLKPQASWNEEGTGFYSPAYTGTVSVKRLYNGAKSRHLLSTDPVEYNGLAAKGWTLEGEAAKGI